MIDNKIPPELTPAITYLKGEYALWKYKIPYFSVVLPMSFVADKFTLVDEIPDSERIEWSLDELFQRDIAWDRVDTELTKYLKNENRPQFFNALTIALLPTEGLGLGRTYESDIQYDPMAGDDLEPPIQIGGIQIQSYKGADDTAGRIRWDRNKIVAVAVDGQHRLAAMKRFEGQVKPDKFSATRVPVIFLIPDERVGYFEPAQLDQQRSIIESLRRIFIDLNKNAKQVSKTRNILLDDLDICSVCVRSLIGRRLSDKDEQNRIPLPVVDWISGKNKFETGPFITTVLILNDIVTDLLSDDKIKLGSKELYPNAEADPTIRKWLKTVFCLESSELEELMSRVKSCYYQEVPLTFQPSEISILKEKFKSIWRPQIYKIFTELTPYKEIISYGDVNGLHKPEFVNLYIAKEILKGDYAEKRSEKIKESNKLHNPEWRYEDSYELPLEYINNTVKIGHWAFKVVFQKALFSSYTFLLTQKDEFIENCELETFTDKWIEAINSLFSSGLGAVHKTFSGNEQFWAGIGLSADGNIEYTKIASTRVSKWLNAWVCAYWMDEAPTYPQLEFAEGLGEVCRNSLDASGIKKLVRARNSGNPLSDSELEDEVSNQVESRYKYIRKKVQS